MMNKDVNLEIFRENPDNALTSGAQLIERSR